MKEKMIQSKILEYLQGSPRKKIIGVGGWWMNFHGGDVYMPRGIPDIIGCCDGRFVAIEVKRPGGKLTRLQLRTLDKLSRAGAITIVAYSVDDVRKVIEREIFKR